MIRLAIVDDEQEAREMMQEYIARYEKERGAVCAATFFTDGNVFLENYKPIYDIVFLDVLMPYLDGMSVAEELRKLDRNVCLVFVSNMAKYAVKGYQVDALGYMVKPVTYYQFQAQVDKAQRYLRINRGKTCVIKSAEGAVVVPSDSILYIESVGHKIVYHLLDEKIETRGTMTDAEKMLEGCSFFRCHRSFLVNLKYVTQITPSTAKIGEDEVYVSRLLYKDFLRAVNKYVNVEE